MPKNRKTQAAAATAAVVDVNANANAPRPHSKIARLVALMGEGSGASLEEMREATGWQAHSVRAALTGLRKRGVVITRSVEGTMPLWSVRRSGQ